MKLLTFSNQDTMPAFGLGTWKSDPGIVKQAVITAIEIGYRHLDCAAIYGNESEVGEGINHCIDAGTVKREEMWITSKLWNGAHHKDDVRPALEKTLNDLQLEYLDLYLMHWPIAFKSGTVFPQSPEGFATLEEMPLAETWSAMEATKTAGLTQHIGVSNFSIKKLKHLMEVGTQPPEMNQIELHPALQQQALVDFCHEHDIHVTAYSPLGSLDRPDRLKKASNPVPLEDPVIQSIAKAHDCSPAQILITWAIQRGTAVIPKSTNEGRLRQNFEAENITLSEDEMEQIKSLDQATRIIDGGIFTVEGSPYTYANVWDEE